MASPSTGSRRGKRAEMGAPASFLDKVCEILDEPRLAEHIVWNEQGDGIVIREPERFASEVLPRYFKHSNYQSFVRQLNIYGFHKTKHDEHSCEFKQPHFRRGERHLMALIRRKGQSTPTSSKPQREGGGAGTDEAKGIAEKLGAELRRLCNRMSHLEAEIGVINQRHYTLKLESQALWGVVLTEGEEDLRRKALASLERLPTDIKELILDGRDGAGDGRVDHDQLNDALVPRKTPRQHRDPPPVLRPSPAPFEAPPGAAGAKDWPAGAAPDRARASFRGASEQGSAHGARSGAAATVEPPLRTSNGGGSVIEFSDKGPPSAISGPADVGISRGSGLPIAIPEGALTSVLPRDGLARPAGARGDASGTPETAAEGRFAVAAPVGHPVGEGVGVAGSVVGVPTWPGSGGGGRSGSGSVVAAAPTGEIQPPYARQREQRQQQQQQEEGEEEGGLERSLRGKGGRSKSDVGVSASKIPHNRSPSGEGWRENSSVRPNGSPRGSIEDGREQWASPEPGFRNDAHVGVLPFRARTPLEKFGHDDHETGDPQSRGPDGSLAGPFEGVGMASRAAALGARGKRSLEGRAADQKDGDGDLDTSSGHGDMDTE